jgi:hypothetical protein
MYKILFILVTYCTMTAGIHVAEAKDVRGTASSSATYRTPQLTVSLPPTWHAVPSQKVHTKLVDLSKADAVYNMEHTKCYVAFGASVVGEIPTATPLHINGYGYTLMSRGSSVPGGDETMPFAIVQQLVDPSGKRPIPLVFFTEGVGWSQLATYLFTCRFSLNEVLTKRITHTITPPAHMRDMVGGTLSLTQPHTTIGVQQGDMHIEVKKGTVVRLLPAQTPWYQDYTQSNASLPILYGTAIYFMDKKYYLNAYDLWSGTQKRIPLTSTAQKRGIAASGGHNVISDYTIHDGKVFYLAEEPCDGWVGAPMTCRTELRAFDLRTNTDKHIAYVEADKILGVDGSKKSMYVEKSIPSGAVHTCAHMTGAIIQVTLATGATDTHLKATCTTTEHKDAQKQKEILIKRLAPYTPTSNLFSIKKQSLSPLPQTKDARPETLIRFATR